MYDVRGLHILVRLGYNSLWNDGHTYIVMGGPQYCEKGYDNQSTFPPIHIITGSFTTVGEFLAH